jgi:hypothetical protein
MRYGLAIVLFLASFTAFGQLQKCGLPTFYPKNTADYHTFSDTCNWRTFRFKRGSDPKWFYQGDYIRNGLPGDTFYTVNNTLITVSYQDVNCHIYNTATQSFWDWTGYSWANRKTFNLDSLLSANNNWLGKNTFKDSLNAEKGLKSGGLIDTKGINTEGVASKAAITVNGVQKGKRRLITANTALDGNDFFLEVNCSIADIEILLPLNITDTEGWHYDIVRTDNTAFIAKFKRPDNTHIKILNKRAAVLRNNGTNWFFD